MKRAAFTVVNPVPGAERKVRFACSYRFSLEPVYEAEVQRICSERGVRVSNFVRDAVAGWLTSKEYKAGAARGARFHDTYGKLSPQQLSVRFTPALFHSVTLAAQRLGFGRRGISAIIRLSIAHALRPSPSSSDDGSRPEQSPAPACAGSPHP
jgi:hypothetical protein